MTRGVSRLRYCMIARINSLAEDFLGVLSVHVVPVPKVFPRLRVPKSKSFPKQAG